MTLVFDDCLVNDDNVISTYIVGDKLVFEADNTLVYIKGDAKDLLCKIAVAHSNKADLVELNGQLYDPDPATASSSGASDELDVNF